MTEGSFAQTFISRLHLRMGGGQLRPPSMAVCLPGPRSFCPQDSLWACPAARSGEATGVQSWCHRCSGPCQGPWASLPRDSFLLS